MIAARPKSTRVSREIRLPDGGPKGVFGASPLHKPLRSAAGVLANNELLSPLDKASLGRFLAAGVHDYLVSPKELDRKSVAQYAREHGVRERVIERQKGRSAAVGPRL